MSTKSVKFVSIRLCFEPNNGELTDASPKSKVQILIQEKSFIQLKIFRLRNHNV